MANWRRIELRLNLDDPNDAAIWAELEGTTYGRLSQRLREMLIYALGKPGPAKRPWPPSLPDDWPKPAEPTPDKTALETAADKFLNTFG